MADRVQAQVERSVDDTLARHGGDERAALVTLVKQVHSLKKEVERLTKRLDLKE